ncbi:hypothetical protein [Roseateles sp. LYH14W]|uniref:Uncharacterized protein n=1 Tax=Pelomonas parva TaxID=3299032 RepID=A0ABW7FCE4_9BURK
MAPTRSLTLWRDAGDQASIATPAASIDLTPEEEELGEPPGPRQSFNMATAMQTPP